MIDLRKVLGKPRMVVEYILKFIEIELKCENDFEIPEFYRITSPKVGKSWYCFENLKKSEILENDSWRRLLPFEFPERKLGWRFSCRCSTETVAKQTRKGPLHDGTLEYKKVVFENHCSLKVLVNYHNCFEEGIEVYINNTEGWKWLWNFRLLSGLNFFKKVGTYLYIFDFYVFAKNLENDSGKGLLPFEFPER